MNRFLQQSRRALGSEATVTLLGPDNAYLEQTAENMWQSIDTFEKRFSRFNSESELSRLNRTAGTSFAPSAEMTAILESCRHYFFETGGIFNPSILPNLEEAGYSRSFDELASSSDAPDPESSRKSSNLDFGSVVFEKDGVRLPENMRVDLGGIGKGYLLDQLSKHLDDSLTGYWIALGGDLVASGRDDTGRPWDLSVQNPYEPDRDYCMLSRSTEKPLSLATSGTFKRRGVHNSKPWHHLIDPRTGQPAATDLLAVTVYGPDATACDIYASCLCIVGIDGSGSFMNDRPEYGAICFPINQDSPPLRLGKTIQSLYV